MIADDSAVQQLFKLRRRRNIIPVCTVNYTVEIFDQRFEISTTCTGWVEDDLSRR